MLWSSQILNLSLLACELGFGVIGSFRTLLEASAGRRCLASERRTEVEAISFIGEVGELPVIVVRSKELGFLS